MADQELIGELAKHGVVVSVRQIQDWRRKGIVSGPEIARRGRRGTEAIGYPTEAPMEVARVHYLLQEGSTMAEVVVSLFGVGVTPTEKALRNAYSSILDRWEASGRVGLTLSEEGGTAFAQRVRRFATSLGRESPEVLARWNGSARKRARELREEVDIATGERLRTSSREVRENDTADFVGAFIDGSGDPYPILESVGLPENAADAIEEAGGLPTFGELRSAVELTSFTELVEVRDAMRNYMKTQIPPFFPEAFLRAAREDMDDPSKMGLYVALGILYPIAISIRENEIGLTNRREEVM